MTYTLFIYYLLIVVVTFLNYFNMKSTNKGIFLFISFYFLFLVASLRFDIGTDYINYHIIFHMIELDGDFKIEVGFLLLNKILIFFNLPFEIAIAIYSFLTLIFIYIAIPRKYLMLFIFLYIASNSYFQSFSLIRQSLAISIILYAIPYINKNSFFKYLIWVIIASSIHLSAILFLPIYFMRKLSVNYFYAYAIIIWYFIVQYTEIIEFLFMNIISLTPYGIYIGGAFFDREIATGSGLGVLFRLLIGIIILLYSTRIKDKTPEVNIYLLLLFLYELSYIAALKIYIFNLLADTFSLFFIYSVPYFIYSFNKKISNIVMTVTILLFTILMYKNLTNDYYQVSGGVGVMPYKSLF